jgi:hypothetical protein
MLTSEKLISTPDREKIKLLLGNAGNNEENNYKRNHSRSELFCHWLVKDK